MADEIKLKAPTVEQQVVVNINGEDKLKSFADTLDKISNNKNLQKYWKTQQDLINATADAYSNFQKKASRDNASELIKVTNALKAMSGTDLSHILPDFDKISKSMVEAQKIAGNIDSAFSVKGFKEAFDSFEALKAYGTDIQKLFSHFGVSSDIGELQQNVRLLEGEVEKLTRRLINAKNANEELRNEFENFKVGSGFADKLDELDRLKAEMQNIRDEATQTFNQFLDANKIDRYDWFGEDRFAEYFEQLENGTLTATNAIRRFKSEYAHLLEDSYRSSGNSFGLEQLQAFSEKLDSIFHQVEETAKKINDIISNGVIAKSVQNLSEDTTLSDSQRSIFGNILQDEEALKSIKSLFQKIVEESNNAKNTKIFNTEQFAKVETIFEHIESTLSSIKSVLVDVGEGEELSPLLKMLDDIREAASNIKLGLNIDLGSEISEKLDQNVSQATQRQVTAYQKLLKEMFKVKSNKEMFDFYRNGIQENASNSELVGIYKGIIKRAEDAEKIGNTNIYKKKLGSVYDELKREIKNANAQLSRAEAKRSENGILGDLFGNNTDLSGVIEQLNIIVSKLDEISESVKGFTEAFKDGLNVNASVEEIEKLTNRVKELEDELAKIKAPTVATAPQESNISSRMKDAFPDSSTDTKPETEGMEQVEKATEKAVQAKKEFATANEGVQSSIDGSENPLKLEAELMEQIAKSAREAADAKKEFVGKQDEVQKEEKATADTFDNITNSSEKFSGNVEDDFNEIISIIKSTNQDMDDHIEKWKLLKQVGRIGDDAFSAKFQKNDGQIEDWYFKKNDSGTYDVANKLLTTDYKNFEKIIISAENKLRDLESQRDAIISKSPNASTAGIDKQIAYQKNYVDILDQTAQALRQDNETLLKGAQIEAARNKAAQEYYLNKGTKDDVKNASQVASEEQKRQKSIEQTNRLLNKQQIIIDGIEKAYSKAANPDLDKGVDSQSDLTELANKKAEIQTLLNKLSGQDRNSSNEKEFLQVEKLVAEYKQLAKDKLKANNPSKQELGGQKLDVLLANQVMQYNKLISQSEKYGDATKEITDELKAQRDLIAEQDKNGIYVARSKKADGSEITANDYYKARDNYKINKSILGSYKDNIKANNQVAKEQNEILREKIELGKQSKGLEREAAESERQSAVNQALKDQLEAWKQIQKFRKEIANTSNGNIVEQLKQEKKMYQEQYVAANKILKNNSDLYNSEQHINELKEITLKTTRQIESVQRRQLNGYDKKLSSYNSKTAGYDATIDRFENGGWTSPEYLQNVKAAKKKLKEYEDEISKLKNDPELINKDSLARVKQLGEEFEELTSQIQNMSAAQKGYSLVSGQKELDKIRQILKENSAMSAEAKGKIKAYYREIESGNPSMSLDKIHGEIMKIVNAEAEAGRAGKRMWDVIKEKAWYGAANVIGTYFGVNDIFRYIQQGIGTVRELDTAMTEVRKVSDATEASYAKFQKTIASTAKDIATTNKELLNSSADFLRLGYSLDQASDLAKNATLFVNVGDGVDITEATEDMITAMKAFDIKAEDSIKIVDDYNQIGNLYALSATDIGEAMKRSASALETGNNSFEQSISLITAMNEIVQNSENTGNSLKVLSLRLRGAKAELESMQEETDGLCESTSKLREQIQSLTGVDIMIDDNTFKSTTDIIKEIGAVWDKLSDSSQAATLELIAGKSRANNIAALLKNYQQIDKVMESLSDAEGSAMRENEAIVDSINGRIKVLSATAEEFWKNFISTDLIKNAVSFATSFLNIVTKIIDRFGVLPSLITPIVAILSAKNKNFGKLA